MRANPVCNAGSALRTLASVEFAAAVAIALPAASHEEAIMTER